MLELIELIGVRRRENLDLGFVGVGHGRKEDSRN